MNDDLRIARLRGQNETDIARFGPVNDHKTGFHAPSDVAALFVAFDRGQRKMAEALAHHDHADTCITALSPNSEHGCDCWRAALISNMEVGG